MKLISDRIKIFSFAVFGGISIIGITYFTWFYHEIQVAGVFSNVLLAIVLTTVTYSYVLKTQSLVEENQKIRRIDYLEKKLECIYVFLYTFFIVEDGVHGTDKQFISSQEWKNGTRSKILDNLHLADKELRELLRKILKSNEGNRIDKKIFDDAKELIKNEYNYLSDEIEEISNFNSNYIPFPYHALVNKFKQMIKRKN